MNCEEVRDLLPAYVFGALSRDDLDAIEAHLRSGHEHDDELVDLRATVFALDRFAEERSLSEAAEAVQPVSAQPAGPVEIVRPQKRIAFPPLWQLAAAAVLVLGVFGSGWLFASLTGDETTQNVSLAIEGQRGARISLMGDSSQDVVSVTMARLERLPADRVYQIWAIRDGQWMRIGVCNTNADGGWKGEFPFQVQAGERIAVTVEPAGGSPNPTTEPLLISSS